MKSRHPILYLQLQKIMLPNPLHIEDEKIDQFVNALINKDEVILAEKLAHELEFESLYRLVERTNDEIYRAIHLAERRYDYLQNKLDIKPYQRVYQKLYDKLADRLAVLVQKEKETLQTAREKLQSVTIDSEQGAPLDVKSGPGSLPKEDEPLTTTEKISKLEKLVEMLYYEHEKLKLQFSTHVEAARTETESLKLQLSIRNSQYNSLSYEITTLKKQKDDKPQARNPGNGFFNLFWRTKPQQTESQTALLSASPTPTLRKKES